jgi:hypothetical protein
VNCGGFHTIRKPSRTSTALRLTRSAGSDLSPQQVNAALGPGTVTNPSRHERARLGVSSSPGPQRGNRLETWRAERASGVKRRHISQSDQSASKPEGLCHPTCPVSFATDELADIGERPSPDIGSPGNTELHVVEDTLDARAVLRRCPKASEISTRPPLDRAYFSGAQAIGGVALRV